MDPLGIHVEDVPALNEMPEQNLLRTGLIDVTKKPFSADPSGNEDSTEAIQNAVTFGRIHKLAVWFPLGAYVVSDTIQCAAGWIDWRTPDSKFLPYSEVWPCVLIGERRDGKCPKLKLVLSSPGFDNPGNPKPVLDFYGSEWHREELGKPLSAHIGATNYNQLLYGIDIHIGEGNPGATGVTFDAAEGSSIQDCTFELGDGYTAILGGPGSGGALFNLTVRGGRIGMVLNSARPTCTVTGCRFENQQVCAVEYNQRGPLILVGCEFYLGPEAQVFRRVSNPELARNWYPPRSLGLFDCKIDYISAASVPAITAEIAVYAYNLWSRGAARILEHRQAEPVEASLSHGWTHIRELAIPVADSAEDSQQAPVYQNLKRQEETVISVAGADEPPLDLCRRHILWDRKTFPAWNSHSVVNVKESPYGAKGDGETDDTAVLQKAIDENPIVFLPKGRSGSLAH
jgi:hypothetical protein